MKKGLYSLFIFCAIIACKEKGHVEIWPQFRGPEGSGLAHEDAVPPSQFSDDNLVWEIDLPIGFSSPVIWGDKIFLTGAGEEKRKISTYCIRRKNGRMVWESDIFLDTIENHHPISNTAQNSCATDGERVIACFGSCGLICYNMDGEIQWRYLNSCAKYMYGNATSPIITNNKVIYLDDDGDERFIVALDKASGSELWKTNFSKPSLSNQAGQSTPCIYKEMVIVHKIGEIAAYSLNDGTLIWSHNILTEAASSPIIVGDRVVVSCWYNVSDESERPKYPEFDELIQKYDLNKNGKLSQSELPENLMLYDRAEIRDLPQTSGSIKERLAWFDSNKDTEIERKEWSSIIKRIKSELYKPSGCIALKTNSKGEVLDSAVLWRISKNMSEVPSPIFYKDRIYMIKDGGILTCLNPETGIIIYQNRIGTPGAYLASPIIANDFIYLFGYTGNVTVIQTGDTMKKVSKTDLKDNIAATPAIIGNSIYIRTKTKLLAYLN